MLDQKYITQAQEQAAEKEDLKYRKLLTISSPHFVLYIKDLLISNTEKKQLKKALKSYYQS